MDYNQLIVALPALTSIATVSAIIVKAAIGLIKTMTAKFEAQITERFKAYDVQNMALKDDIYHFRESVESKFNQLDHENRQSRTEMKEYVADEFRKMDDRITRYENIQMQHKDQIHSVEKSLMQFKLDIAQICNKCTLKVGSNHSAE